ncbi:MAG: hypothetical protein ACKPKO_10030, partial [Candidatus Fonsibacter sp.]
MQIKAADVSEVTDEPLELDSGADAPVTSHGAGIATEVIAGVAVTGAAAAAGGAKAVAEAIAIAEGIDESVTDGAGCARAEATAIAGAEGIDEAEAAAETIDDARDAFADAVK